MTLESGVLLHNRYRILDILGQGGMGSIYRAIDENLGVEVAVKENLFTTDEYARQFKQEAVILASLRHPNLPRVSDHFVIDEVGQYLIMDYIQGNDLRDHMERELIIQEEVILDIGIAICDALCYMHSRMPPVLHRDIKPGNVRISPEGDIYLVDFGLAKVVYQEQETSTGARAMTPGYSPPEQYGAARTDHRSDIYSLGATMYAALTGVIPEDSLARTMDQLKLTPIRDRNPKITQATAIAVEKALEVKPSSRYQSVKDFQEQLLFARGFLRPENSDDIKDEKGIEEKKDESNLSTTNNQFSKRADFLSRIGGSPSQTFNRYFSETIHQIQNWNPGGKVPSIFLKVIIGIVMFVSIVGIFYLLNPVFVTNLINNSSMLVPNSLLQEGEESGILKFATETTDDNSKDLMALTTIDPGILLLSATPSSEQSSQHDSPPLVITLPQGSIPTGVITTTPEQNQSEHLTPTPLGGGTGQIAFASTRAGLPQIWIVDIDGENLQQITTIPTGACQPDWAPDGKRLVFISPCADNFETYLGSALFVIDEDGSNMTSFPIQGIGNFDPAWSPKGDKIVFTALRESERPQIWIRDLETGELDLLSENNYRDYQPSWSPDGSKIIFISTRQGPFQVWTMDPDGTNQERFSVSGDLKNTNPVLSPNGQLLVFTQSEGIGSVPRLKGVKYPDGAIQEFLLFTQFGYPMREADFSSDGFWVVFESWPDGTIHDLYLMSINGAGLTQITSNTALDFDSSWRPVVP